MSESPALYRALPDPPGLLGPASLPPMALTRPLMNSRVTCGFPSPAEDWLGEDLDLNQRCIRNAQASFFVEADTGESMVGFGILPGDTLIVDRSIDAKHGHIAIVLWEGGYMCKKLRIHGGRVALVSAHSDHPPILVPPDMELVVWGVVTWSFHPHIRQ